MFDPSAGSADIFVIIGLIPPVVKPLLAFNWSSKLGRAAASLWPHVIGKLILWHFVAGKFWATKYLFWVFVFTTKIVSSGSLVQEPRRLFHWWLFGFCPKGHKKGIRMGGSGNLLVSKQLILASQLFQKTGGEGGGFRKAGEEVTRAGLPPPRCLWSSLMRATPSPTDCPTSQTRHTKCKQKENYSNRFLNFMAKMHQPSRFPSG